VSGVSRNASNPINALLNYVYAIFETEVRLAVLTKGQGTAAMPLTSVSDGVRIIPLTPQEVPYDLFEFIPAARGRYL
jgi:hypothetical protein